MQVILHAGAHCTDEDRLIGNLAKNRKFLVQQNISVPPTRKYRQLLRDVVHAHGRGEAMHDSTRDLLMDTMIKVDEINRVILSNENFFCVPKIALSGGVLYPKAEQKIQSLGQIMDQDNLELFMGLRNPATLIPALFDASPETDFLQFIKGSDPGVVRWSELILRIRSKLPDLPITLWCNEDTPLIWDEILQSMTGLPNTAPPLNDTDVLIRTLISEAGYARFQHYLAQHPDMDRLQMRRVTGAFLDKFALEDQFIEEIEVPGWTDEMVETLTQIYDQDMHEIRAIKGVRFIEP